MAELESEHQPYHPTALERAKSLCSAALKVGAAACAASCLFGAAPARTGAAESTASCWNGPGIYGYAGIADAENFNGIMAQITETAEPRISSGHVAAWIGFGAEGAGTNGTDEWLQAGIERTDDSPATWLYYEIELPHRQAERKFLGQVAVGAPEDIRLTRISIKPEEWILDINGQRRGPVFDLPAGHQTWIADFTGESWMRDTVGCNVLRYSFKDMAVRRPVTDIWHSPLRMHKFSQGGYVVENLTKTSFRATAKTGG